METCFIILSPKNKQSHTNENVIVMYNLASQTSADQEYWDHLRTYKKCRNPVFTQVNKFSFLQDIPDNLYAH